MESPSLKLLGSNEFGINVSTLFWSLYLCPSSLQLQQLLNHWSWSNMGRTLVPWVSSYWHAPHQSGYVNVWCLRCVFPLKSCYGLRDCMITPCLYVRRAAYCKVHILISFWADMTLSSAPLFLAKLPVGLLGGLLLQKHCPEHVERRQCETQENYIVHHWFNIDRKFSIYLYILGLHFRRWARSERREQFVE